MGRQTGLGAFLVVSLFFVLLWHPLAAGQAPSPDPPPRPPADAAKAGEPKAPAQEKVRCPDCDDEGKATCPDCRGRGEIFRPCDVCAGSGKRPCTVCTKDGTPGLAPCEGCGGKGMIGAPPGRTCTKCGGQGNLPCTVCGATGLLPCKKEIYVKVCSRCAFVGKVTCPTCQGEKLVSPAVLEARRKAARAAASASKTAGAEQELDATTRRPGLAIRAAGDDDEKPVPREVPSAAELEERFVKLSSLCDEHAAAFTDDPRQRLEDIRKEAAAVAGRLRGTKGADATASAKDVGAYASLVASLRDRWTRVRAAFDDEQKTRAKVKDAIRMRDDSLSVARGHAREEIEIEMNDRLDTVLRVAEKRAAALGAESPAKLQADVAGIVAQWPALKEKSDKVIEAAAQAAAEAEVAKATEKAKQAEKAKQGAKSAKSRTQGLVTSAAPAPASRPARVQGAGKPQEEAAEDTEAAREEAAADDDAPQAGAKQSQKARARKGRGAGAEDGEESTERSVALTVTWAVIGLGAAALAYYAWSGSRRPRRRDEREAPQIVS